MEKDRGARIIAIIALVVGVIGLSIGFASFSSNLSITDTTATVTPDDSEFRVYFTDNLTKALVNDDGDGTEFLADMDTITTAISTGVTRADEVVINNESRSTPFLSGLSATFTQPGQSVTYTFYIKNVGQYDAFLKSVTAKTSVGAESLSDYVECNATNDSASNTSKTLIANACKKLNATVKVYDASNNELGSIVSGIGSTNVTKNFDTNNKIAYKTNEAHKVTVTLEYLAGADKVDEEFLADFGDIVFNYSSAN